MGTRLTWRAEGFSLSSLSSFSVATAKQNDTTRGHEPFLYFANASVCIQYQNNCCSDCNATHAYLGCRRGEDAGEYGDQKGYEKNVGLVEGGFTVCKIHKH